MVAAARQQRSDLLGTLTESVNSLNAAIWDGLGGWYENENINKINFHQLFSRQQGGVIVVGCHHADGWEMRVVSIHSFVVKVTVLLKLPLCR